MNSLSELIYTELSNSLDSNKEDSPFVALNEPTFQGQEWEFVKDCLDSTWVSSAGQYIEKFEQEIASFTGIPYVIATVNGTAALHLSLLLGNVKSEDEVLMPALTFVATANAICYTGATPHFIDSEEENLGICPNKLSEYLDKIAELRGTVTYNNMTNKRISAIIVMHTFGHPSKMDELSKIGQKWNIQIIEDAAESLGSFIGNKHTGHWGTLSAISFNGNKIITTGGGGAILTNDKDLALKAKHFSTTAKVNHSWKFFHDYSAFNYRMPNLNASLGLAQIKQLDHFIEAKRKLALSYKEIFDKIEGVDFFTEKEGYTSNYWLNALILDKNNACYLEEILEKTNSNNIMTRPCWTLLNKLPMFKECPKMDLSIADSLEQRIINIPSSPFLAKDFK